MMRSAMKATGVLLVVCLVGCDNGNGDCSNQPPTLDWSLTTWEAT